MPLLLGRLAVALVPVRPLVPVVGRLLVAVGLEVVDGRVVVPLLLGRLVLLLADMLPDAVGRVEEEPLIDPALLLPERVAPFWVLFLLPPLIEPAVPLLPCLILAT